MPKKCDDDVEVKGEAVEVKVKEEYEEDEINLEDEGKRSGKCDI